MPEKGPFLDRGQKNGCMNKLGELLSHPLRLGSNRFVLISSADLQAEKIPLYGMMAMKSRCRKDSRSLGNPLFGWSKSEE